MSGERRSVLDVLRDAIRQSGDSHYAIAEAVGVTKGAISLFLSGKRGLGAGLERRLLDLFELEVTVKQREVAAASSDR